MSLSVRTTAILGFLALSLAACGGSSSGGCDDCATAESDLRCGPTSGCDEPTDPGPAPTPFPASGPATSPTSSVARTTWGSPCVEEIISSNPFTTRWTYGAKSCTGGWCAATCSATNNRIYLTFVNSTLSNVSPVSVATAPETGPFTIAYSLRNGSGVTRACAMTATWFDGGQQRQVALGAGDTLGSLATTTATALTATNASVSVVAECWTPGQPTVQRATATKTFNAVRTCRVDASYFLGSDGIPAMEISHTCTPTTGTYP